MYTLLYFKWITPKGHWTAHGTRLSVCGHLDGRGVWGEGTHVYVYVWLSPFAVHLELLQHC